MSNFFASIDFFGEEIKFLINKNTSYKTKVGGIFSMIWCAIGVAVLIFNLKKVFQKQDPTTSTFQQVLPAKIENITTDDLQMIVDLNENDSNNVLTFYDFNITTIASKVTQFKNQRISVNTEVPSYNLINEDSGWKKCQTLKESKLANLMKIGNQVKEVQWCSYFKDDLLLGGDYAETGYVNLISNSFYIDLCSIKNIPKEKCKNETYLNAQYDNTNWGLDIRLMDKYYNDSAHEGYSPYSTFEIVHLDFKKEYQFFIRLRKNVVETDDNFIFNFFEKRINIFYSISSRTMVEFTKTDGKFGYQRIMWNIQLDKGNTIYVRSYFKLDSALANFAVILNFTKLLLVSINRIVNWDSFGDHLINQLYRTEEQNFDMKLFSTVKLDNKKKNDIQQQNMLGNTSNIVIYDNKNIFNPKPPENQQPNKISDANYDDTLFKIPFSLYSHFAARYIFFCPGNKRINPCYLKAIEKLNKIHLDFMNLLQSSIKIDNLVELIRKKKELFSSNDQIIPFYIIN
jgi:hypothetical protein